MPTSLKTTMRLQKNVHYSIQGRKIHDPGENGFRTWTIPRCSVVLTQIVILLLYYSGKRGKMLNWWGKTLPPRPPFTHGRVLPFKGFPTAHPFHTGLICWRPLTNHVSIFFSLPSRVIRLLPSHQLIILGFPLSEPLYSSAPNVL